MNVEVRVSTEEDEGDYGWGPAWMKVNVTTEVWERGGRRRVCDDGGLETVWLCAAL